MSGGASDFGRYLQSCRKAKEISLSAVAQRTRITIACLQQIENEDLQQLPNPVFVKGFLRAYAEVVGADAQEAISRYEASRTRHLQTEQMQSQKRHHGNSWLRIVIAITLLAAVIAGTLYLAERIHLPKMATTQEQPVAEPAPDLAPNSAPAAEKESAQPVVAPAPVDETSPPGQEKTIDGQNATNEAITPAISPNVETKLTLEITAVEVTWFKVIADGEAAKEFSLQPGKQMTLTAKSHFNLLIGNAAGIHLSLNGQPVHVPGKSGQVVTMQLP